MWTEPNKNYKTSAAAANGKVPVIYYLSRNGQLEHPHFMDVPLSSPEGLFLKGNININLSLSLFPICFSVWLPRKMITSCLLEIRMYSYFFFLSFGLAPQNHMHERCDIPSCQLVDLGLR